LSKKDDLINLRNTQPFYMNADLEKVDLTSLNTSFDVILMDPPLEEYYLRSLGSATEEKRKVGEKCPFWTVEQLENLNIPAIAANPCFLFLWTGNGGEGLEIGRRLLKKWGFRRSEDIVWIKTNKDNPQAVPIREKGATFIRAKEHCLLGIRGSVRRNIDAHIIHSNVDTDVIIAEEPKQGSTRKPEELYSIIEHFCLGRRRLELFGEDHNIRPGWVTIGDKILSSNWDKDLYNSYFEPPNSFSNLVGTTPEIENLRPRSPSRDDSKILWYNPNKKVSNKGPPDRDIY
jgi:mRNA (2'-O-methyladenosine-N6-)-methyltransferase